MENPTTERWTARFCVFVSLCLVEKFALSQVSSMNVSTRSKNRGLETRLNLPQSTDKRTQI
eukprot:6296253-Amphidinium_carterae.1